MADKVLPQRVSVLGDLPRSGWPGWEDWSGEGGEDGRTRAGEASHRVSQPADPGACPRVSGIHGSFSFREEAGPDHRSQADGDPRGHQEASDGMYFPKSSQAVSPSWPPFPGMSLGLRSASPTGSHPLGERTLTLAGFEMLSCYIGLLTQSSCLLFLFSKSENFGSIFPIHSAPAR